MGSSDLTRREIPAEANEWMVDEKPAPNRKDVWMDGGEQERCANACSAVGLGLVKNKGKKMRRRQTDRQTDATRTS